MAIYYLDVYKRQAYVCNADNPEGIMELYFNLREYSKINTKKWQTKPENRELYDYIEYPDSIFICVLQVEYISDPYILSLGINNGCLLYTSRCV